MSVTDYETAEMLGEASPELIKRSEDETPTGAVPAYYDEGERVWQYVQPSQVSLATNHWRVAVRTVYVE